MCKFWTVYSASDILGSLVYFLAVCAFQQKIIWNLYTFMRYVSIVIYRHTHVDQIYRCILMIATTWKLQWPLTFKMNIVVISPNFMRKKLDYGKYISLSTIKVNWPNIPVKFNVIISLSNETTIFSIMIQKAGSKADHCLRINFSHDMRC